MTAEQMLQNKLVVQAVFQIRSVHSDLASSAASWIFSNVGMTSLASSFVRSMNGEMIFWSMPD